MDPKELERRIMAQSDDDPTIHSIYKTGEDDGIEYLLVVAKKQHEGREMLKIRYFALNKNDEREDTWMQNGITARTSDVLEHHLGEDLSALASGIRGENDETKVRNIEPAIPE